MHRRLRIIGRRASLILPALVGLACTWMPTLPVRLEATPIQLEALGPGTVFESIDAAAVDALIYAYGQACTAREAGRMRGGAIRRVAGGFSYGPIRVAGPQLPHQLKIGRAHV